MFGVFVLLLLLFWQVKTVQPKLALFCDSSASAFPTAGIADVCHCACPRNTLYILSQNLPYRRHVWEWGGPLLWTH